MEKPADAQHPIHPLIQSRWSPRAFSGRPVADETLRSLFEAARWAASCFNAQPWRFVVARKEDTEAHARLLGCLAASNQLWAKEAPVLLLSVAQSNFEHNGKPNRHAMHDVGLAVSQFSLQATELGLGLHQMAGFDAERARTELKIPEGYEPVAAIALGYPGDPEQLPDPLRERESAPRVRKPQAELIFDGMFGRPL